MNKKEVFKKEINYIKNKKYRDNVEILIELLPDYFFEVEASSTGKYHPKYALGERGLVRHTKAAVKMAYELYSNDSITSIFNDIEKDLMIVALILHDGLKLGETKEKYTKFDHPLLVAEFIKKNQKKTTLTDKEIDFIVDAIKSHMGQWNVDYYTKEEVLPLPKNKYQKFVHMCDYLASRKFINIEFKNDEIVE